MAEPATFGPLSQGALEPESSYALFNGKPLDLTRYEHAVLVALIRGQNGNTAGRTPRPVLEEALDAVRGGVVPPRTSNVLEVLIGRLRKRLAAAGVPVEIRSVRGRGYTLLLSTTEATP